VADYLAEVQARIECTRSRCQPGPGILRLRKRAEERAHGE
jgi:hypothetical protein